MKYPTPLKLTEIVKALQEKISDELPVIASEVWDEVTEQFNEDYQEEVDGLKENGMSARDAKEEALDNLRSQFLDRMTTDIMDRLTDELDGYLMERIEV